jgi:hypothetical protein
MSEAVHIQKEVLDQLSQLSIEKQQKVLDFVNALRQEEASPPPLNMSLQQIAALPISERDRLLAPYIALMAEDFRTDSELTAFSVLDDKANY